MKCLLVVELFSKGVSEDVVVAYEGQGEIQSLSQTRCHNLRTTQENSWILLCKTHGPMQQMPGIRTSLAKMHRYPEMRNLRLYLP